MILDNRGVEVLNDNECIVTGEIVQNNIPILEQNYVEKMNSNNGFTEQRMFRKIASVPVVAQLQATEDGYDLDDPKDLYRFLRDNPEYMTVERLVSTRQHNIIVK